MMKFKKKKKEPVLIIVKRLEKRKALLNFYKSIYKEELYIEDMKKNNLFYFK